LSALKIEENKLIHSGKVVVRKVRKKLKLAFPTLSSAKFCIFAENLTFFLF